MFKNAFIYRIVSAGKILVQMTLQDSFARHAFVPCGPTQEKSIGWVPARGIEHGDYLESIESQLILKLVTETKTVPASAIDSRIKLWRDEVERQTGRKPGKKETKMQKEDIRLALLPTAFPKQAGTTIWIDTNSMLMVIDAPTQARADDAVSLLVATLDGLVLQMVNTNTSPAAAMAEWLQSMESPERFTVDRECELKACDESKAVVKYAKHPLDIDEVVQHITQGMMPTKLAMTFDDRVSFVLTEGMQLKKIDILDVAMGGRKDEQQDAFDADVAIATGELKKLLPALFDALGGESV